MISPIYNSPQVLQVKLSHYLRGSPKGAALTHFNIVNNGRYIGERLRYTENDITCIPVPLYHCFGMVLGNMSCISYGSAMVFDTLHRRFFHQRVSVQDQLQRQSPNIDVLLLWVYLLWLLSKLIILVHRIFERIQEKLSSIRFKISEDWNSFRCFGSRESSEGDH